MNGMSYTKVTTTETNYSPASRGPRFLVWVAAIVAAPFSGGLSLLALVPAEASLAREKRLAAEDAARRTERLMPEVQDELQDMIRRGQMSGAVRITTRTTGWGPVERKFDFKIETDIKPLPTYHFYNPLPE